MKVLAVTFQTNFLFDGPVAHQGMEIFTLIALIATCICLKYYQILSFYLVFHDFTVLKKIIIISDLTCIILYMLLKFELQNHFLYVHLPLIEV